MGTKKCVKKGVEKKRKTLCVFPERADGVGEAKKTEEKTHAVVCEDAGTWGKLGF